MLSGRPLAARNFARTETEKLGEDIRFERPTGLCSAETAVTYDQTKELSHALAEHLESEHRDLVVSKMSKALRKGKVFVDWSQNDQHKTTICVYSLRAREQPTVSTPVTWEEVETTLKKKDARRLVFRCEETLKRVEKMGDLFAEVDTLKQKLPKKWKL